MSHFAFLQPEWPALFESASKAEASALPEESKRFDLLLLNLQLARLRSEPRFTRMRDQVKSIAGLLEEKASIPMIRERLELIQDIQNDEWWQDVTIPMLERVRVRLRALVTLIEKRQRQPIYTDFVDELGAESHIGLPGLTVPGADLERFRAKGFLSDKTLGPNQIDFVKLIVDYLTEHGVMSPALLYDSPFIDFRRCSVTGAKCSS